MKITRRQLRQMIQENINDSNVPLINESINTDTYKELENVLKKAYQEGRVSYRADQRVIGIPGKTEDRPVNPNPHYEVVYSLVNIIKEILEDQKYDKEPDLDYRDIADARKDLPKDSTFEDLANKLGVSVARLQEIEDDINQGYEDRYVEDQDWDDDDYPKVLGYTDPETGEKVMINVASEDDMDDILSPLLRQYPDLPYSID
jgi:hypothetical protein